MYGMGVKKNTPVYNIKGEIRNDRFIRSEAEKRMTIKARKN